MSFDFKKKASDTWNNPNNHKKDIEGRIEKALKETWNDAIEAASSEAEDFPDAGMITTDIATKILKLKEK